MEILFFLPALINVLYVIFIVFTSIQMMNLNAKKLKSPNRLIFAEVIYTVIGPIIGFLRYDEYGPDIPFSPQHVLTIIILVIFSSLSFWISRFSKTKATKFQKYLLNIGLLQGMILCIIVTIHFIPRISDGILFPMLGFEMMSPFIAFFLMLKEFYLNYKFINAPEVQQVITPLSYHGKFVAKKNNLLIAEIMDNKRLLIPFLLGGLLVFEICIAVIFGQQFESIYYAFSQSVGFIFSVPPLPQTPFF